MQRNRLIWSNFQSMDLVGFSSCSRLGTAINLCSLGVPFWGLSHIAVVSYHPDYPWPLLCESTSMYREPCVVAGKVVDGVQWHKIAPRVRSYRGFVWHYRARIPLLPEQEARLQVFLSEMTGRGYDALGALGARDTLLGWLARRGKVEDLVSLFCSELTAAAGKCVGVFPQEINASGYSPNRLARRAVGKWKTHSPAVLLKGNPCVVGRT